MLPGFRFLFTAIVLSMSILIFGLGAAALLRAAHEEFANLPSRRAPPEPMFARQNDDQPPTLALLRIDPPVAEKPVENVPAAVPEAATDVAAQAAQTPEAGPAEPEKLAALKPAEPVQVEPAKPETSAKETPRGDSGRAGPARPKPKRPSPMRKRNSPPSRKRRNRPSPPPRLHWHRISIPSKAMPLRPKIATLGGPAVVVDQKTAAKAAEAKKHGSKDHGSKARQSAARKRARERRRIAARRARLAQEAALTLQQQQPNPFATFPLTQTTR